MIRTEDKLARMESTKRGTVLRKAIMASRNQPVVFFRTNSAEDLFKFPHTYAGNDEYGTPKAPNNPTHDVLRIGGKGNLCTFWALLS